MSSASPPAWVNSKVNPDTPGEKVWVFVDGSNVWIEAKRLAATEKKFFTSEDWRLRISWEQLVAVVASHRPVVKNPNLYLSKKPESQSVWNKLNKIFNVVLKNKGESGREVNVDEQIIEDIKDLARKTLRENRSTIVLISGDGGFEQVIRETLAEGGWNVEVYSWAHAVSPRLQNIDGRLYRYQNLDGNLSNVTYLRRYVNEQYQQGPRVRVRLRIALDKFPIKAVVNKEQATDESKAKLEEWWKELDKIAKWPVQCEWIKDEKQKELILVFQQSEEVSKSRVGEADAKRDYDITVFLRNWQKVEATSILKETVEFAEPI